MISDLGPSPAENLADHATTLGAPARRTLLIDTDTASDDAVALIMALRSTTVRVAAITVVAGNVPVEVGTRNALFTAELCGSVVPVHTGAAAPLVRPLQTADWFHGEDGLGDHGYAPRQRRAESTGAVEAIVEIAMTNPGIEIVTLGPLTNLALALAREPQIASRISRCVVMGGAPCCEGNVTPAAEFNIWVDPEAAQAVFRSDLAIEMVGWQLSRGPAVLNADDMADLADLAQLTGLARRADGGSAFADFAVRSNSVAAAAYQHQTGEVGIALPDPVAMAIALRPELCLEASGCHVEIETASPLTRGMTVVDQLGVAADPRNATVWRQVLGRTRPVQVCWRLDVPGWKRLLRESLVT